MAIGAFLAKAAPAIISGVSSLLGGRERNAASAAEAVRNRQFQERMSSTAHQREVKDLRAAGLNPILSATGGRGASSPGGSMAQFQDVMTPAVNSAMAARRLTQDLRNLQASEGLIRAQTGVQEAQRRVLSGPAVVGDWMQTIGDFWNSQGRPMANSARDMLQSGYDRARQGLRELLSPTSGREAARGDTSRRSPLRVVVDKPLSEYRGTIKRD